MNLGLRSLSSTSIISFTPTATSMPTSTMIHSSSSISSVTPTSPSAMSTSILVSPTSSHPSPSPSLTITHQSSSVSFTSSPQSQKPPPPSTATATLLASHSFSPNTTTSSSLTPSTSSSSNNNPLDVSAAALQTSDNVTTFLPTNTMLTFPSVPTSVSQCVTTCLQNAVASVNCVTITSVECYCGKPQFVSNTYNCVESQCPADFNQAENIAEEFCALVSTSLSFPSPTATFTITNSNSTTSSAASTTRDALQPKALSVKLLVSSFAFMMALYALQN